MCLYDAGFHVVETKCLGSSFGCTENLLLLVYRPDLIPNYQVEDGVTSDHVNKDIVVSICEEFPRVGERVVNDKEVSQLAEYRMFLKTSKAPSDFPVRPSFPWCGKHQVFLDREW